MNSFERSNAPEHPPSVTKQVLNYLITSIMKCCNAFRSSTGPGNFSNYITENYNWHCISEKRQSHLSAAKAVRVKTETPMEMSLAHSESLQTARPQGQDSIVYRIDVNGTQVTITFCNQHTNNVRLMWPRIVCSRGLIPALIKPVLAVICGLMQNWNRSKMRISRKSVVVRQNRTLWPSAKYHRGVTELHIPL